LSWIPSPAQDSSSVTCTASSTTIHASHSSTASVPVRLRLRPRVTLQLLGGRHEGDTVTFRCSAEAVPPVERLEWRLAGSPVPGEAGGLLRLEGADRRLQGAVVQCRATGPAGEGIAETRLHLLCERGVGA
jgi:hypothetical protein